VLEPLSGYLRTGQVLHHDNTISGEPYNFGPPADQIHNVLEMLEQLSKQWSENPDKMYKITGEQTFHEAGLLKLNCDKALAELRWRPVMDFKRTTAFTSKWYQRYYEGKTDMYEMTGDQIDEYCEFASEKELEWVK